MHPWPAPSAPKQKPRTNHAGLKGRETVRRRLQSRVLKKRTEGSVQHGHWCGPHGARLLGIDEAVGISWKDGCQAHKVRRQNKSGGYLKVPPALSKRARDRSRMAGTANGGRGSQEPGPAQPDAPIHFRKYLLPPPPQISHPRRRLHSKAY